MWFKLQVYLHPCWHPQTKHFIADGDEEKDDDVDDEEDGVEVDDYDKGDDGVYYNDANVQIRSQSLRIVFQVAYSYI